MLQGTKLLGAGTVEISFMNPGARGPACFLSCFVVCLTQRLDRGFSILAYEILRALVFCTTFIASVRAPASQNAELECFGDVLGCSSAGPPSCRSPGGWQQYGGASGKTLTRGVLVLVSE